MLADGDLVETMMHHLILRYGALHRRMFWEGWTLKQQKVNL
jgi:hypothetical protein